MISHELTYRIERAFAFEPTAGQRHAMELFGRFMTDRNDHTLMIPVSYTHLTLPTTYGV